jgi:hypothetical protein
VNHERDSPLHAPIVGRVISDIDQDIEAQRKAALLRLSAPFSPVSGGEDPRINGDA